MLRDAGGQSAEARPDGFAEPEQPDAGGPHGGGCLGWDGLAVASLVLSVTLAIMALGMLQAKRYFEELYFQATRTSARPGATPFGHPSEERAPRRAAAVE